MFEWYLKKGALSNYLKPTLPTWKDFIEHPSFDEFWKARSASHYLKDVTVPTLHVAGWFDQEDFYGPMKAYAKLEQNDKQKMNFIVVGPWNHGGWGRGEGDRLGNLEFKQATGRYFREKIQAPWFAFHLKGKGSLNFPEAQMFQTGSNEWKSYEQWPPLNHTTERKLYFHANGKLPCLIRLSLTQMTRRLIAIFPIRNTPSLTANARLNQPIRQKVQWSEWQTEDQRFVANRPDVLMFETDVLNPRRRDHIFRARSLLSCLLRPQAQIAIGS
ncbi:MAG: CocE/NonD family hydrolase [Acidobacteriota bacterium]